MRVYFIDIPEVSSGMRRTYHKKLEVFSGVVENGGVRADTIYTYGKRGWTNREYKKNKYINLYHHTQHYEPHSSMPTFTKINYNPVFTTLELAQAAKLLLIERMAKAYEDELQSLRELFERNVPDVSEPLKSLKDDYPEYFI